MPSVTLTSDFIQQAHDISGSGIEWEDPTNAASEDSLDALWPPTGFGVGGQEYSDDLLCTRFRQFPGGIPANVPDDAFNIQVSVRIKRKADDPTNSAIVDRIVVLLYNNTDASSNVADTLDVWPSDYADKTYGSDYLFWGRSPFTPDEVNDDSFGVKLVCQGELVDDTPPATMGPGHVDVIELTISWDETGTGTTGTGTAVTGTGTGTEIEYTDIPYLPFSAFVRDFLGFSGIPTGPTQKVDEGFDAYLAKLTIGPVEGRTPFGNEFSTRSFPLGNLLGFGITYRTTTASTIPFETTYYIEKRLTIRGNISEQKIGPLAFVQDEVYDAVPRKVTDDSTYAPSGYRITKYVGYRFAQMWRPSSIFIPNCIVDSDDNIIHIFDDSLLSNRVTTGPRGNAGMSMWWFCEQTWVKHDGESAWHRPNYDEDALSITTQEDIQLNLMRYVVRNGSAVDLGVASDPQMAWQYFPKGSNVDINPDGCPDGAITTCNMIINTGADPEPYTVQLDVDPITSRVIAR